MTDLILGFGLVITTVVVMGIAYAHYYKTRDYKHLAIATVMAICTIIGAIHAVILLLSSGLAE